MCLAVCSAIVLVLVWRFGETLGRYMHSFTIRLDLKGGQVQCCVLALALFRKIVIQGSNIKRIVKMPEEAVPELGLSHCLRFFSVSGTWLSAGNGQGSD